MPVTYPALDQVSLAAAEPMTAAGARVRELDRRRHVSIVSHVFNVRNVSTSTDVGRTGEIVSVWRS